MSNFVLLPLLTGFFSSANFVIIGLKARLDVAVSEASKSGFI